MSPAHTKALVVAYYLSRCDARAYEALGFGGVTATHEEVGRRLGVKGNTVKNMRDEFDPLHDNARAGWHQRPPSPGRLVVARRLSGLEEEDLREVVMELLGERAQETVGLDAMLEGLRPSGAVEPEGGTRQRTGRAAEEHFVRFHERTRLPASGALHDVRDLERGYDFEIELENGGALYVEVKGIAARSGGVLFTDREWRTARKYGERYVLAVVTGLEGSPEIGFIQDPTRRLAAQRELHLAVRVQHRVQDSQLRLASVGRTPEPVR